MNAHSFSSTASSLTLFDSPVHAGFPSPAADYAQKRINLNEHLLINEQASYLFRVRGESMLSIGIYDGDTLVVDRSITPCTIRSSLRSSTMNLPSNGYTSVAALSLVPENPSFPIIELSEGHELCIWGVVTFNLHKLLNV
jgi:DNA polymerase V